MRNFLTVSFVCLLVFFVKAQPINVDSNRVIDSSIVNTSVQKIEDNNTREVKKVVLKGYPVVLKDDTAFYLYNYNGAIAADRRADLVNEYVNYTFELHDHFLDSLTIEEVNGEIMVSYDEHHFLTVSQEDADYYSSLDSSFAGITPLNLARMFVEDLRVAQKHLTESKSWEDKMMSILWAVLLVLGIYFFIKILNRLFVGLIGLLPKYLGKHIHHGIKIKEVELVSAERLSGAIMFMIDGLRKIVVLILVYSGILALVKVYPGAKMITDKILEYLITPLVALKDFLLDFIPNLFFIVIIVLITKYILRFLRFISEEIEKGNLEVSGFHIEWIEPTFKIVKFLIYAFSAVMIFPYLPGSNSPAFKGISIFLGVLFSLGSSSAISNLVAGLVITYMRPFKMGDRVLIDGTEGDVIDKTLLVTKIKTIKNVEITIPNSMILNSHITNFNANEVTEPLILHTNVTIGYDVPWNEIHELLIKAANNTELIEVDPKPFVYQISLDDFYVNYELNAFTFQPHKKDDIYSELHANIQDAFNQAGVEIMSPSYSAIRDGNHTTVASDKVPSNYTPPKFNLGIIDKFFK